MGNIRSGINRLESLVIPSWHYINHNCICTRSKVLKINSIYTYKEGGNIDIVRLLNAYCDEGYLHCTLFFFSRNQIITVSQILQPYAYIIWRLMDNGEFDEIMSIRLWQEIEKENELLEFDF
jgi:hypothetical protein